MAKFLILSFLCIFLANNVAALDCYVTDLIALRLQGVGAAPALKDCKTYFDDIGVKDVGDEFRCYWMTAEAVQGHVYLQGCLTPNATCDKIKDRAGLIGRIQGLNYQNINCSMCATDSCNGGVEHAVVFKSEPKIKFSFEFEEEPQRGLGYFTWICILVVVLIVVGIAGAGLCAWKGRNSQ